MRLTTTQWIARLNFLADHPDVRAEHRAICAILGHEPSGEHFLTTIPIEICRWCADEFYAL